MDNIKLMSIMIFLGLAMLALYFKFFPLIINPKFSNISLIILTFILISLIVYVINYGNEYLALLQAIIFLFIFEAVPNLRLSYPPLHDPYYHYACTLNILNSGTLDPIIRDWYWLVEIQLRWPDMHLLTVTLSYLTEIDIFQFFRYQQPFLAIIPFLFAYLLVKFLTGNLFASLISAFFTVAASVNLYYLSEYHPQGIAIVYLSIILYSLFKFSFEGDYRFLGIGIILSVAFSLSHYFTPLFWGLVLIVFLIFMPLSTKLIKSCSKSDTYGPFPFKGYAYVLACVCIILYYFIETIAYNKPLDQSRIPDILINFLMQNSQAFDILLILIVVTIISFFLIAKKHRIFRGSDSEYNYSFPSNIGVLFILLVMFYLVLVIVDIASDSSYFAIPRFGKWLLLFLTLFTVANILNYNAKILVLIILYVIIFFAAMLGALIIPNFPTDRLIGFWLFPAAPLASLAIIRLMTVNNGSSTRNMLPFILLASIIIMTGILSSQIPAFFLREPSIDPNIWYSNIMPNMDEYKSTGEWTGQYIPISQISHIQIITDFHTRVLPFFFGKHSTNNIDVDYYAIDKYIFINPKSKEATYSHKISKDDLARIFQSDNLDIYK